MPAIRNIVRIDEEKCTGCGLCVPSCEEGAIRIIDGKARLVSDIYCDGLGNCLGKCPEDAITIEQREAEAFDLEAVGKRLSRLGSDHPQPHSPVGGSCPGSLAPTAHDTAPREAQLGNWPVQLRLVPVEAPYFEGADLLIAADCVPFAFADFHERLLADHALVIGCPKLDEVDLYIKKLAQIFARNDIRSVRVAHMEVPCCFGLVHIVSEALKESGKTIPTETVKIGIRGEVQETQPLLAGVA